MAETTDTTEVEETYAANEDGVAYTSESAPSAEAVAARPATIAPAAATGRRKEEIGRAHV